MIWIDYLFWSEGLVLSIVAGLAVSLWGLWQCVEWICAYLNMSNTLIGVYRRMLQEKKLKE